jgi:hypothetical protein
VEGAKGAQGVQGPIGATGAQGLKGDKGDKGATGATGPQGLKGDTGATGSTGATRPTGPQRPQGPLAAPVATTSGTGAAYTATVSGFTQSKGAMIVIIPHVQSTSATCTLSVNGASASQIRRLLSDTTAPQAERAGTFLTANTPVLLIWEGTYWLLSGHSKPSGPDITGVVPTGSGALPTGGSANQVLAKTSATNFAAGWTAELTLTKLTATTVVGAVYQ